MSRWCLPSGRELDHLTTHLSIPPYRLSSTLPFNKNSTSDNSQSCSLKKKKKKDGDKRGVTKSEGKRAGTEGATEIERLREQGEVEENWATGAFFWSVVM